MKNTIKNKDFKGYFGDVQRIKAEEQLIMEEEIAQKKRAKEQKIEKQKAEELSKLEKQKKIFEENMKEEEEDIISFEEEEKLPELVVEKDNNTHLYKEVKNIVKKMNYIETMLNNVMEVLPEVINKSSAEFSELEQKISLVEESVQSNLESLDKKAKVIKINRDSKGRIVSADLE